MSLIIFAIIAFIVVFIITYRNSNGEKVYIQLSQNFGNVYDKISPYSFREVRKKVKELGQEYTKKQYLLQIVVFSVATAVITYLYFYNLVISIVYVVIAIMVIPYLTYLRCKRLYSEYIFEQIQVYTTNTIWNLRQLNHLSKLWKASMNQEY